MPGAKRNQAKKTSESVNGIRMNPTREEVEDLMRSAFAGLVVHMNGLEKGWDTEKMMEFKRFIIDELKQATEPEGWEHYGSVGVAVSTLKCECERNKIFSITDGEEHDTGIVVQFICRNVPREETRFNLRIVEARLKKKFGDEFNLSAGTKCGTCDEVHPLPHVLGISDGAFWKQSKALKEALAQNKEIHADNEKLKELGLKNLEELEALKAELEFVKEEKGEIFGLLEEWQDAHKELQAEHEKWITTTLEENEDFLGEVRKSGWKAGREEESARTIQVEEELEALKAENERLKADLASAITKKPRKPKAKPVLAECAPAPEINEKGVRRFFVSTAKAAEEPVYADKPEE